MMLSEDVVVVLDSNMDEPSEAVHTDELIDTIKNLTYDLANSREETQKAEDQIACLVSLIKRSWQGDKIATTHLANIVGFPDPFSGQVNGYKNKHGNSPQKTRALQNWEKLSLKILERDYARVENEIRTKQNMYMRHRELYFDEILNTHDENMSRIPLHRKASNLSIEEIDNKFFQQRAKSAPGHRATTASKMRQRRQLPKGPREVVKPTEVQVSDFFIQNSQPNKTANLNKGMSGLYQYSVDHNRRNQQEPQRTGQVPGSGTSYGDPQRYIQPKLFENITSSKPAARPRPVSAALLRERGRLRTRPRSAGVQSSVDRSANIEESKVNARPPSSRPPVPRLNLDDSKTKSHSFSRDGMPTYTRNPSACGVLDTNGLYVPEEQTKPSITVRVRSAIKRPECIDNFDNDVQKMSQMEEDFRKTTLQLQKKLGIDESSLVY